MEIFSLKSKIIVITGAAGLLGSEHSKAVALAGGIPIILDLDLDKLNDLKQEINKNFKIEAEVFKVDITNEKEVEENCKKIILKFGRIDGLINNAANNPKVENKDENFSRLENFPIDLWDKDLSVSLKGSFICSKYYGYQISKNKNGGSIINISSDLGLIAPNQNLYKNDQIPPEEQIVKPLTYSVTKHGIIGLTRYLSTYWSDNKVRCNAICPGGIENGQDLNFIKKISKLIPLGRMAKKNELQGLIIYLLSDSSSYMNGSILSIDGGRTTW
jgi:NAD(P)-dependent dehydrogenase (short-subunit alcohol dehydrogenase family)